MPFFDNNDTISAIHQQAVSLSISKEFAGQHHGKVNLVDFQGLQVVFSKSQIPYRNTTPNYGNI